MNVVQVVEIPANRKLIIDVPPEVPIGSVVLTFSSKVSAEKKVNENRKTFHGYVGKLSPEAFGNSEKYQKSVRAEWDD